MSIGAVIELLFERHSEKVTHDPQDDKQPLPSMDSASQDDNSPKL